MQRIRDKNIEVLYDKVNAGNKDKFKSILEDQSHDEDFDVKFYAEKALKVIKK